MVCGRTPYFHYRGRSASPWSHDTPVGPTGLCHLKTGLTALKFNTGHLAAEEFLVFHLKYLITELPFHGSVLLLLLISREFSFPFFHIQCKCEEEITKAS